MYSPHTIITIIIVISIIIIVTINHLHSDRHHHHWASALGKNCGWNVTISLLHGHITHSLTI